MPLQKLYEKIYFDGFDLKAACKPFDNYEDETVTAVNFERVMLSDTNGVESLSPQEANDLSSAAPRLNQTY